VKIKEKENKYNITINDRFFHASNMSMISFSAFFGVFLVRGATRGKPSSQAAGRPLLPPQESQCRHSRQAYCRYCGEKATVGKSCG
jgi:hypothetical protein